jgi:hypothetical protein
MATNPIHLVADNSQSDSPALVRPIDQIPTELKTIPTWGVWKSVPDANTSKPKKIPFRSSDGEPASSNNRDDWGTFDAAVARYLAGGYTGLGFGFFPEYNVVGIDRDKCRDPKTGVIESWALQEMASLPTYTEISPSETGYKQFLFGSLPQGARHTKAGSQSEMYDGAPGRERFFTVTGVYIAGNPTELRHISSELLDAHKRMMAFDLVEAFRRRGMLREKRALKQLVKCPWGDQHTGGDDEAALFKKRGRSGGYVFKCLHSHCADHTIVEVYNFFGYNEDRETDLRPSVLVGGDLHKKTQEIFDVLVNINSTASNPIIYLFGNAFGRITWMTLDDRPATDLLTHDKMRHLLAQEIRFQKLEKEAGFAPAYPPDQVITNMLVVAEPPPYPRIRRLVSAPVFAPDGTLIITPGFHAVAGVYYAPTPGFILKPISTIPSAAELVQARQVIEDELLVDFCFVSEADKAHAIALLLLFFARDLIDGDLPLHLILKPEVGTGAGKLADACMIPALGGRQGVITDCDDEDEWRKRITAVLLEAPEAVLLDNITKINSHQLAALFTSKTWIDRILGMTRMVTLPADMPWVATGNNPEIGYDLVRRIVSIQLDAKLADPTTRSGFKHELPKWVIEQRADVVWAALTLIQHWIANGRKPFTGKIVASFEQWSAVMGGILEAAGIKGFGTNAATFRQARNIRGNAWNAVVEGWWVQHKSDHVGSNDIWSIVQDEGVEGDLGLHSGKIRDVRVAFGLQLRNQRGRQFVLKDKTQVRIEAPEDATTRKPFCLYQIGLSGELVTVGGPVVELEAAEKLKDIIPF